MNKELINLKDIMVQFENNQVLKGITLGVNDKEFVTLLGPSGCGKTTLLRIIAGFIDADEGDIIFNGKNINNLPAYKREVNTIFQRYALFPHLNVYENIEFGLKVKKIPEKERKETVTKMLELVNLEGFGHRNISRLSGGQQQRVAIARALANRPKVLLLDEPLSALDLKLRKAMQRELKEIQQELDITFLYVTHDQEEALTMSDKVVVMNDGQILQIGTPEDIYNEPKNAFVASFIGESNILDGVMEKDYLISFLDTKMKCVDKGFLKDESVDVVIRPEDIQITSVDDGQILGRVDTITFKGVHYEIMVDAVYNYDDESSVSDEDIEYTWMIHTTKYLEPDSIIGMKINENDIHIMKKMEVNDEI